MPARSDRQDRERLLVLQREKAKRAARRHLLPFTLWTFPGFEVNWHHSLLADKLTDFAHGRIRRLIIEAPPRHTKSELASRRLPAFIFGINPNARVIGTSYGDSLAVKISRDIKRIVLTDRYREIFPQTTLNPRHCVTDDRHAYKNTSDEWEIVGHDGGYLARGVGGGTTGQGGDYLIVDDPIKDAKEAYSETRRDDIWDWFQSTLKTRQSLRIAGKTGAGILVILTRWHLDDLAGRLIEEARTNPYADKWEVIKLRAMRREEAVPYDPRCPGQMLWPSAFSEADYLAVTDPDVRAALYDQDPVVDGGDIIKLEWLQQRYSAADLQALYGEPGEWVQHWDPKAGSKDPRSSFVVGQLWFFPHRWPARCYLIDQVRGQWEIDETMAQIELFSKRHPQALRKRIEGKADGKAIRKMLCDKVQGMEMVEVDSDKVSRLRATRPLFSALNVWYPEDAIAPWMPEYVHEMTTFPKSAQNDQVDTTSQALSERAQTMASGSAHWGWWLK